MLSCNLKLVRERHVSRRDGSSVALWQPTYAEMLVVLVYQQAKAGWSILHVIFFAVLQAACQSYCLVYFSQVLRNIESLCVVDPSLTQIDVVSLGG